MQHSDMREEMRNEVVDLTVSACEKFSSNYEVYESMYNLIDHYYLYNLCRRLLVISRTQWTSDSAFIGTLLSAKVSALRSPTRRKTYSIYTLEAIWP